jgi:hypothetical protein
MTTDRYLQIYALHYEKEIQVKLYEQSLCHTVIYVFLLLGLCILIVQLP